MRLTPVFRSPARILLNGRPSGFLLGIEPDRQFQCVERQPGVLPGDGRTRWEPDSRRQAIIPMACCLVLLPVAGSPGTATSQASVGSPEDTRRLALPSQRNGRWHRLLHNFPKGGNGSCLEIGCGTGVHAAQVRELGWAPYRRPPVRRHTAARPQPASHPAGGRRAAADPRRLDARCHRNDGPYGHAGFPMVLREVARVLRPGAIEGCVPKSVQHTARCQS